MGQSIAHNPSDGLWLRSKRWDLTWISLSVVVVALPYTAYYISQLAGLTADDARNAVNILIALSIGGPHMYATYTRTAFEPSFRRRYRSLLIASLAIPAAVLVLGTLDFVLLLTLFFGWASVHVLHQIVYLTDCYRKKEPRPAAWPSRAIDYAFVATSLYPLALYRCVHGTFQIGQHALYIPDALKHDWLWIAGGAAFSIALVLFTIKTVREYRDEELNRPKTLLILVSVVAMFFTPAFHELDVAFQGLNAWHSFQYLGLTWYINRLRLEGGQVSSRVIQQISQPKSHWKYYGFALLLNLSALIPWSVLVLTRGSTGISFDEAYYLVVLCFLFTHYFHDHLLFSQTGEMASLAKLQPALR